ncbi:MAG: hypothetical protein EOO75_15535, partial [Myxococcales bacterium]
AQALHAHRKGDRAAAADGYRAVLARDPRCLDAWMNLAAVAVLAGQSSDATAAFERALALAADDARVARDAGIGLAALGQLDPARLALDRALALDPALIGARLVASRVCAQLGDDAAALAHALAAVRDAPHDASTHLELYRVIFDDRALDPAIEAATTAARLDPGSTLARYFLAGARGWRDGAPPPLELPDPLRDALALVPEARDAGTRAFASKRATLAHALAQATRPGLVAEFGVRHGVSTRVLASEGGVVHAFDRFEGLPEAWAGRAPGAFSTAGEVPGLPAGVVVHTGWFADTVPAFAATLRAPLRLLHVDSDLYESARTVLTHLCPWIAPGTVLVFDEYLGHTTWRDDEYRAFTEAAQAYGWTYEYLALCWVTGQASVRIVAT